MLPCYQTFSSNKGCTHWISQGRLNVPWSWIKRSADFFYVSPPTHFHLREVYRTFGQGIQGRMEWSTSDNTSDYKPNDTEKGIFSALPHSKQLRWFIVFVFHQITDAMSFAVSAIFSANFNANSFCSLSYDTAIVGRNEGLLYSWLKTSVDRSCCVHGEAALPCGGPGPGLQEGCSF